LFGSREKSSARSDIGVSFNLGWVDRGIELFDVGLNDSANYMSGASVWIGSLKGGVIAREKMKSVFLKIVNHLRHGEPF
jgi:hypothetical protein